MTIAAILHGKGHDAITVGADMSVGDAARILLYLLERDAGVRTLRGG